MLPELVSNGLTHLLRDLQEAAFGDLLLRHRPFLSDEHLATGGAGFWNKESCMRNWNLK